MLGKVEICGVNTTKLPTLTAAETDALLHRAKDGDAAAREKLVEGNLRLVLSVIQRFSGRGENADDLFQVGCVGLLKAIDNFDTSQNVRFSTYGVPMIIGEIRRYLRDNSSIRVSRSMRDTAYRVLQAREKLQREQQREPTVEQIARELGIRREEVVFAMDAVCDPVSLFEPIYSDGGDAVCVMDQVRDTKNTDEDWLEQIALKEAMARLSERERQILALRYSDGKTQMSMSEVYASNVNSVVSINVSATTNYFGQTVQTAASGTGFFITEDGYILTNHHVISDASSVKVTLYNGETYDAKVIGSDEDYDIAVLKIDVTGATPVVLGDSSKVAIGESVAAVGNPLGELTFSMSEGIVSCVNRAINVDGTPFNMIQVDCSINPGNSGGPLFNSYGEVIGIVSAKYSSYSNTTVEGIGFAIPINDVVSLVKDIMTNGYVTNKAYMGITPQTMTAQMAQQYRYDVTEGVFVCSVDPDSAADKAGLKLGDVITKMDDTDITSYEDLVAAKKSYSAGDTVTLTVYREGKTIEVELTFDAAPETTETSSSDQSTDNSYNGNGGYGNGGNGYYSNPWDFFNNFFGYGG